MIRLLQVPLVLGKLVLDPSGHTSRIPFLTSSMAHRNKVLLILFVNTKHLKSTVLTKHQTRTSINGDIQYMVMIDMSE